MNAEGTRGAALAAAARRAAASPHALLAVGALLGLIAVAEEAARVAVTQTVTQANTQALFNLFAAAVLALATTLPVAFLEPVPAAIVTCLASVLSVTVFRTLTVAGMGAMLITLYRLGSDRPTQSRARLLAPTVAVPFIVLAITGSPGTEVWILTVLLASLGPAAAWAGIAERARSEALRHDAARQIMANTLVARTAQGERARIARELHDVVAHHISMIVIQSETARLTTPGMPAAGAQRLSEIGDTARAGLTEMRRILGVLREAGAADPARYPQPSLQDLNKLLDNARSTSAAGTRLIVSGSPITLDSGTELAAYRIVQEALTNVRRHAPGAAVDVELRYADDTLWLRVRDDGPGLAGNGRTGGHGLHGMRERAAAVGGELRLGNASGGGFVIKAELPTKAGGSTPTEG